MCKLEDGKAKFVRLGMRRIRVHFRLQQRRYAIGQLNKGTRIRLIPSLTNLAFPSSNLHIESVGKMKGQICKSSVFRKCRFDIRNQDSANLLTSRGICRRYTLLVLRILAGIKSARQPIEFW